MASLALCSKGTIAAVGGLNRLFLRSHDGGADANTRLGARHEGQRYISLAQGWAGLRSRRDGLFGTGSGLRGSCEARQAKAIGRSSHVLRKCLWLGRCPLLVVLGVRAVEAVGLFLRLSGQAGTGVVAESVKDWIAQCR